MWPLIPAYRSFGNVTCPSGANCELPHCIFGHDVAKAPARRHSPALNVEAIDAEPVTKRLKLNDGTKEPVAHLSLPQAQANSNVFVGSIIPRDTAPAKSGLRDNHAAPSKKVVENSSPVTLPRSATRPVSPPPTTTATKPITKPDVPTPLMPRKLVKEPATFTKRIALLKALHIYMQPQNDKIAKAVKPEIKALHLTPNQLIRLAVDEEEKIAKENGSVYENILKQRLVKLKSMTPEVWVKERKEVLAKEKGESPKKAPPKKVDTALTPKEEVIFLSALDCPQTGLERHGYVTKLPLPEELAEARKVLDTAGFWEECDRCNTRFQVFPERREEDGALTTGGQCRYHWGKRIFPKKTKNAVPEPTRLACCSEPVGSPGCVTHDTHVFNVKDFKRLSIMMPFMETPENDKVPPHSAVCFDCEMGYTTNGLEMLRLTVVSWPTHKPLIDVLVRPLGHLLDVNTRFSGVQADQFLNAKPYDPENPKPDRHDLRIVDSPYKARELFFAHISPTTPVLGHALENDLNTIRIIHPTIVDTVLLYPTRQGLPYRHGLRTLAKMHLGTDIQQGGAMGHDSFEDARTTGELVRFKIMKKWKVLKVDGWQITDEGVFPPMPKGSPPPQTPVAPSMVLEASMAVLGGKPVEKRKFEGDDGGDEDGNDPPVKK